MANTVIALKKSGTSSAVPTSLANGEIAINYADGVIFYKHANGTIASFTSGLSNYFGTVNAAGTLLVADTNNDVLDIRAGQNIIITGDAINDRMTINADLIAANSWANTKLSNGTVTLAGALTTTGQITANAQININATGADEGGEIQLQASGNYTNWSFDSFQNNARIFARTGTTVSNVNFFHSIGGGSIRMGVNKTDPAYTVDVSGDVNISGTYRINGVPIASGTTDLTPANNWANTLSTLDRAIGNSAANSANAYTVTVGAASNAWSNTIATSGNNYAVTIGASSNSWSNTIATAGNNYTITVGASSNAWANTVGAASNSWSNTIATAGNNYAVTVSAASNAWANTIAVSANAWSNTKIANVIGAGPITVTFTSASGYNNSTVNLATSGVTATTYGGTTQIPAISVDSYGRITSASNIAFSSGGVTITAESASASTFYPIFTLTTTGTMSTANVDSTDLKYVPSTGTFSALIFNSTSDITMKTDIEEFDGIELIRDINPVSFKWKRNGIKSYGVIAQELEKTLPELVQTDDEGLKSVSYNPIIAMLLDVVKKQQKEIDKIKKLLKV